MHLVTCKIVHVLLFLYMYADIIVSFTAFFFLLSFWAVPCMGPYGLVCACPFGYNAFFPFYFFFKEFLCN